MNDYVKLAMLSMYDKVCHACVISLKHSRAVLDFQVMDKKEYDEGWGKTHTNAVTEVKKTHKYIGILTINDNSVIRHFAVSHREPVFAAALVLKHTLAKYDGKPMYNKIMRVHQKFFNVVLAPNV